MRESQTVRIDRQRLEAIKKSLPVRDSVKQQLQQRQKAHVEFIEGTEQFFKPFVDPNQNVFTATEVTQTTLETLLVAFNLLNRPSNLNSKLNHRHRQR